MIVRTTPIEGLLVFEPRIFRDERGHLVETWSRDRYVDAGIAEPFVQDNLSRSVRGVLRGMHFQRERPQGKLVGVAAGEVFDVGVDLRPGSPTFGRWWGCSLSGENHRQMYLPPGFAHGFLVLSDAAVVIYKCTEFYDPGGQGVLLWNDPAVGIAWPETPASISAKDREGLPLTEIGATLVSE